MGGQVNAIVTQPNFCEPPPSPPQAIITDRSSTANSGGTIYEPEMKVESKYLGNLSCFN